MFYVSQLVKIYFFHNYFCSWCNKGESFPLIQTSQAAQTLVRATGNQFKYTEGRVCQYELQRHQKGLCTGSHKSESDSWLPHQLGSSFSSLTFSLLLHDIHSLWTYLHCQVNSIRSPEEKHLFVKCGKKENCHLLSAYEVLCTQKQLAIFSVRGSKQTRIREETVQVNKIR